MPQERTVLSPYEILNLDLESLENRLEAVRNDLKRLTDDAHRLLQAVRSVDA